MVDMIKWIVVINLIGIVYQFYLSTARYYKKHQYEKKWTAHLKEKEDISSLIIEYENYDEEIRADEKHKLMLWTLPELKSRLEELRKKWELEQKELEREATAQKAAEVLTTQKAFAAFLNEEQSIVRTHSRVPYFHD